MKKGQAMKIENIVAYEVLDSRANPTVKVKVELENGVSGEAIVPSGASTGKKEALELRDGGSDFFGKRVQNAVNNVNEKLLPLLKGECVYNQRKIDTKMIELDGTENLSKIGANATLGVSMAVARAAANSKNIPLYRYLGGLSAFNMPRPMLNVINGGAHANNNIDFQEYMIIPTDFSSFKEGLFASAVVYHELKNMLKKDGFSTALGDEGGFAPDLEDNEAPIKLLLGAIKNAGFEGRFALGLDVASSEFYENGVYTLKNGAKTSSEMIKIYAELCEKYPIISIEDGLAEDDFDGWVELTKALGSKTQLVGDDLFVTNEKILRMGIEKGMANAILIKPNQIGTISQTLNTIHLAHTNGYKCVMSHRSGESEDSFIADFSTLTSQIKTGAPARGERTAKYNRLFEIELGL